MKSCILKSKYVSIVLTLKNFLAIKNYYCIYKFASLPWATLTVTYLFSLLYDHRKRALN